ITSTLHNGLELHTCIRWILGATVIFERIIEGEEQETRFEFNSEQQILLIPDEIEQQVEAAISRLLALILEMSERESDFVFKSVFATTIRLAHYNPIGGSSYIKTPEKLANKRAIVNVKNNDSKCFLYAIASAVFPGIENAHRPTKYKKYLSIFKIDGLTFPLDPKQISKFEELNPQITVHVQCY